MPSRRVLILSSVAACSLPIAAVAQRGLPRVGFVLNSASLASMQGEEPEQVVMRGFVHGMRALGYVEGRNVVIERRTADGKLDRLESILRELAEVPVDVIVVTGNFMTRVAKRVTTTVPIVSAGMGSDVLDIVASYAQPGGNITGLAPTFGPEVTVKRLEQISMMLPKAKRVAFLGPESDWKDLNSERTAASAMGLGLYFVDSRLPDVAQALRQLEQSRPDVLFVPASAELFVHLGSIAQFARRVGLPDFYAYHQAVEAGGLASYGHDPHDIFRRAARYVDRILKGDRPATLPIEQMSRLELVINLKTARLLGIKLPSAMVLRADRVVE